MWRRCLSRRGVLRGCWSVQVRRLAWAMLAMLYGCGSVVGPPQRDAGSDSECEADACDDGNPCTTDGCGADGGCAHIVQPKGTTCEGVATDPIHGECNGDPVAPSCGVQEWTCLRNPPGTACIGGVCDGFMSCCSGGCIDVDGACQAPGVAHCGASGSACAECSATQVCGDDGECRAAP